MGGFVGSATGEGEVLSNKGVERFNRKYSGIGEKVWGISRKRKEIKKNRSS